MFIVLTINVCYADANDEEHARLKALDAKCAQAREELIRPLREAKIEQCVGEGNKDRAWCEKYFSGYGMGNMTGMGTRTQRLYDQIPECVEAFNAWHHRKR